jgi:hypothetical protein
MSALNDQATYQSIHHVLLEKDVNERSEFLQRAYLNAQAAGDLEVVQAIIEYRAWTHGLIKAGKSRECSITSIADLYHIQPPQQLHLFRLNLMFEPDVVARAIALHQRYGSDAATVAGIRSTDDVITTDDQRWWSEISHACQYLKDNLCVV